MLKKTTHILLLACSSFLLLVTATVSSRAQTRPPDSTANEFQTLTGRIRWKKDMGVVPKAPGSNEPAENICSPFYVGLLLESTTDAVLAAYTNSLKRAPDEGDYYICKYRIEKVPAKVNLHLVVGMGDVFSLPKPTMLPFHYSLPWITENGSQATPPRRSRRSFSQNNKYLRIGSVRGTYLAIDLVYNSIG